MNFERSSELGGREEIRIERGKIKRENFYGFCKNLLFAQYFLELFHDTQISLKDLYLIDHSYVKFDTTIYIIKYFHTFVSSVNLEILVELS